MTLMAATAAAVVFRTWNDQFEIYFRVDGARQGLPEAGPAGATVVLGLRGEQGQITTGAMKDTCPLFIVELTGEGGLSAFPAKHRVRLRRETLSPFSVRKSPVFI